MSRPCSGSDPAQPPCHLLIWALGGPARVALSLGRVRLAIGSGPRAASAELPGLVAGLLAAAGDPVPDRVGVAVGPGSFTGIKVSLAFARGLAAGWERPVHGIDPLAALVLARGAGDAQAAVDALRDQAAVRAYRMGHGLPMPDGPLRLEPWTALPPAGGLAVDPDMAGPHSQAAPTREAVLEAAMALMAAGRWEPAEPVWSRPSGAEEGAARRG